MSGRHFGGVFRGSRKQRGGVSPRRQRVGTFHRLRGGPRKRRLLQFLINLRKKGGLKRHRR